jgi:hypothetical protein
MLFLCTAHMRGSAYCMSYTITGNTKLHNKINGSEFFRRQQLLSSITKFHQEPTTGHSPELEEFGAQCPFFFPKIHFNVTLTFKYFNFNSGDRILMYTANL